jgi:hypothetical protein
LGGDARRGVLMIMEEAVLGRSANMAPATVQCKALWEAREEKKPRHERKPVPPEPVLGLDGSDDGDGLPRARGASLDAQNAAAMESFNSAALEKCANCGRTFLPEK